MYNSRAEYIIDKYGRSIEVTLSSTETVNSKAFIRPLVNKDHTYMGGKYVNMGYLNNRNYLYIGKKNVRLDLYPIDDIIIKTQSESYTVKRAEKVYLNNEILYIQAILQINVKDDSQ